MNPIPKSDALSRLYVGTATIYEYQNVLDPNTFQTISKLVPVYEDEPCRLSYSTEQITNLSSGVAEIVQRIQLFIRPDIIIKAGSVIEVTQHGRTGKYKRADEPTVYTNHQQIALTLDKEV